MSFTSLAALKIQQSTSSLVSALCLYTVFLMWHSITGEGLGAWNHGYLKDSFVMHGQALTHSYFIEPSLFMCKSFLSLNVVAL